MIKKIIIILTSFMFLFSCGNKKEQQAKGYLQSDPTTAKQSEVITTNVKKDDEENLNVSEDDVAEIKRDVNRRKSPHKDSDKIDVVSAGTEVKLVDAFGDWTVVTVLTNEKKYKNFYIWTPMVTESSYGRWGKVNGLGCNLRKSPTTKEGDNIVAQLKAGTEVRIEGVVATWLKIKTPDEKIGWVYEGAFIDRE